MTAPEVARYTLKSLTIAYIMGFAKSEEISILNSILIGTFKFLRDKILTF